jgi:hypothetical protein
MGHRLAGKVRWVEDKTERKRFLAVRMNRSALFARWFCGGAKLELDGRLLGTEKRFKFSRCLIVSDKVRYRVREGSKELESRGEGGDVRGRGARLHGYIVDVPMMDKN